MKIKQLELMDLSTLPIDKSMIEIDSSKIYEGYVNEDAAKVKLLDAIAFAVENVQISGDKLVGDFQVINGKASELFVWVNDWYVQPLIEATYDIDTDTYLSAKIASFVAYPE